MASDMKYKVLFLKTKEDSTGDKQTTKYWWSLVDVLAFSGLFGVRLLGSRGLRGRPLPVLQGLGRLRL